MSIFSIQNDAIALAQGPVLVLLLENEKGTFQCLLLYCLINDKHQIVSEAQLQCHP
jgi:hypothetical protein